MGLLQTFGRLNRTGKTKAIAYPVIGGTLGGGLTAMDPQSDPSMIGASAIAGAVLGGAGTAVALGNATRNFKAIEKGRRSLSEPLEFVAKVDKELASNKSTLSGKYKDAFKDRQTTHPHIENFEKQQFDTLTTWGDDLQKEVSHLNKAEERVKSLKSTIVLQPFYTLSDVELSASIKRSKYRNSESDLGSDVAREYARSVDPAFANAYKGHLWAIGGHNAADPYKMRAKVDELHAQWSRGGAWGSSSSSSSSSSGSADDWFRRAWEEARRAASRSKEGDVDKALRFFNLSRTNNKAEVKKRMRDIFAQHHPDKHRNAPEEQQKEILRKSQEAGQYKSVIENSEWFKKQAHLIWQHLRNKK